MIPAHYYINTPSSNGVKPFIEYYEYWNLVVTADLFNFLAVMANK